LHGLLVSQPEDPWAYLDEHLSRAKAVATGGVYTAQQIPSPQAGSRAAPEEAAPPPPPGSPPVPKSKSRGSIMAAASKVDALMQMLRKTRQNLPLILPYLPSDMGEMLESSEFANECQQQFKSLDTQGVGTLHPEALLPILHQLSSAKSTMITPDQCQKFVEFFDANEDGQISLDEFTSLTQFIIVAAHMESDEGKDMSDYINAQESHFNEFMDILFESKDRIQDIVPFLPDWLVNQLSSEVYMDDCMDRFDALDADGSNSLSPDELVPVVIELSSLDAISINMDKLRQFIQVFDTHGNGLIMRDEFIEFSQFLVVMNFLSSTVEGRQVDEAAAHTAELKQCETLILELQSDISKLPEIMSFLPRSMLNEISSDGFKNECIDSFAALDVDNNKTLDASEVFPVLQALCEGHPIVADDIHCKEFFQMFDKDGNGVISLDEFWTLCKFVVTMGYLQFTLEWRNDDVHHDRGRVEMLLKEMKEHSERLDEVLPLLPMAVQDELTSPEFAENCMAYFDELDKDGSGSLEPTELVPVFIELAKVHPFALTDEQCLRFVDIFDTESTGVISRNEFINAVRFVEIMGYLETEEGNVVQDVADVAVGEKKVEELLAMMERDRGAIAKIIPLLPESVYNHLTSDEFVEQCLDRFDDLDKDKNGVLEPNELFPLIIELSEAHPYSIDMAQCERFTAIFDLRGDGVVRIDEFLDFARFLAIMSYMDSEEGKHEFADGLEIFADHKQIEDLITMLEGDRQAIRMVIPYLPMDLQNLLLSERFTKSCQARFKELDTDRSGSLEPTELFPVVMEMIEAETSINSSSVDIQQVERFTAIFDDENTGVINQKEFVNFARFVMVMSFLKTEDGQRILDIAFMEQEAQAEDNALAINPSAPSSPMRGVNEMPPSPQQVGHLAVDLDYYQQKSDRLGKENSDQRQRLLQMEEKMRLMEERMDMQDNKLRHAHVDLSSTK